MKIGCKIRVKLTVNYKFHINLMKVRNDSYVSISNSLKIIGLISLFDQKRSKLVILYLSRTPIKSDL